MLFTTVDDNNSNYKKFWQRKKLLFGKQKFRYKTMFLSSILQKYVQIFFFCINFNFFVFLLFFSRHQPPMRGVEGARRAPSSRTARHVLFCVGSCSRKGNSGVESRADGTEPMEFGNENEVLGGFRTSLELGIVLKTI